MKPLALDLFCGAGGAAVGLDRAGYTVVGVDIKPQPRYPFKFVQADAMTYPLDRFGLIWASPPCQAYTDMKHAPNAKGDAHPKLVEPIRERLKASGRPWVIENVEGAPLVDPITLCGSHFGLASGQWQLRRHRLFECSFPVVQPECRHEGPVIGVYGGHVRCRSSKFWRETAADFPGMDKKKLAQEALGIDWMTMNEMSESIPPAFSEYIGRAAMPAVEVSILKDIPHWLRTFKIKAQCECGVKFEHTSSPDFETVAEAIERVLAHSERL